MRYVLINPSWQVPDSILKKEILPRLDHFERLGYEVRTVGGRVTVSQPPGDDNALGRLAFMFPNDHAVYLHDTPARSLFGEEMRALSHGCVRVEDPERLAEIVLGLAGGAGRNGHRRPRADRLPAAAAADPHRIFHRVRRRRRSARGASRRVWPDAKSRQHTVQRKVKIETAARWVYTADRLIFPFAVTFWSQCCGSVAVARARRAPDRRGVRPGEPRHGQEDAYGGRGVRSPGAPPQVGRMIDWRGFLR